MEFSQEIVDSIIERLSQGETLRAICREDFMPAASTVCLWVTQDPVFAERYARARNAGLDLVADEVLAIADEKGCDPADKRVRFDARRWYLSKMAPKRYGDRLELAGELTTNTRTWSEILAEKQAERARKKEQNGDTQSEDAK